MVGAAPMDTVVEADSVVTRFGATLVHDGVDLQVRRGEIFGIVGGSGSGKSVLLRALIMLLAPAAGRIRVFGQEPQALGVAQVNALRRRLGVMFQRGALFGSVDVLGNVGFPLREFTTLSERAIDEIASLKLALVGLPPEAFRRPPQALSGGMIKRAAIARALALDPELLFLDEPSAGLDPVSAGALDELVLKLKEGLGLTVVLITHDLDSLWRITDRVAFLGDKRILAVAPMAQLSRHDHPLIASYFSGPRARAARPPA